MMRDEISADDLDLHILSYFNALPRLPLEKRLADIRDAYVCVWVFWGRKWADEWLRGYYYATMRGHG